MEQKSTEQAGILPASPEASAAVVAQRCREDDEFKQRLKQDPKAALFEAQAKQPPDGMKIVVHENTLERWHIAIPSDRQIDNVNKLRKAIQEKAAGDELTDEHLQDISGGFEIGFSIAAIAIAASVGVGVGAAGAVAGGVVIAGRANRQ